MVTSHPDAEYGRCLSIRYQPHQQEELDRLLQREWEDRECSSEGDVDAYIESLPGPVPRAMKKKAIQKMRKREVHHGREKDTSRTSADGEG